MGKNSDNEKDAKPKETEEGKLLKQLNKPLKKLVKLYGPEKANALVQQLITSIEDKLAVKAAKNKIEKEAKAAKRAIDRKTREALAALSKTQATAAGSDADLTEEQPQPLTAESPETGEIPPVATSVPVTSQTEVAPAMPARGRGTKSKPAADQTTQGQE